MMRGSMASTFHQFSWLITSGSWFHQRTLCFILQDVQQSSGEYEIDLGQMIQHLKLKINYLRQRYL